MVAPLETIEERAGISDKRCERATPCRPILGGSVRNDPVETISADKREVGRVGPGAPLGATGDVSGPFKAEPEYQFGETAGIATGIEARRPTGRRARTCFNSKQWVAGFGNKACGAGGSEDRISCRCRGGLRV